MDFVTPSSNFQAPDILGSYLKAQASGQNLALGQQQLGLGQQQLALGNQQLQEGPLKLEQLRQLVQRTGMTIDAAQGELAGGYPQGGPQAATPQTATDPVRSTGGVQNGPQATMPSGSSSTGALGDPSMNLAIHQARSWAMLNGQDPNKAEADARDDYMARVKLATQPQVNAIDSIRQSQNPVATLMANYNQLGPHFAAWERSQGLDPNDPRNITPNNVRESLDFYENGLRAQRGETPVEQQYLHNVQGPYGQQLQEDQYGKRTEVAPMHVPTFDYKEQQDPNDPNKNVLVRHQTGGMPGSSPTNGTPVTSYLKGITPDDAKNAEYADYFRVARGPLEQLEGQGIFLSTKARAALISAATSDSDSLTGELKQQLALKYAMSPQEKEYMAALMPMLQAMGHSMSGQRLTSSAMHTTFEGLVPQSGATSNNLKIVAASRDAFYKGMLTQSGPAAEAPQYQNTIGSDLATMRTQGSRQAPTAGFISKGYRFKGGDPSKQENWEKAGG